MTTGEHTSVLSSVIIRHLPDLRRYALALVGTQSCADALVEHCLERLLANQASLAEGTLRLAMFAMFDLVCDAAPNQADPTAGAPDDGLSRAVWRLPDDERKALLLVTVERFSYDDTATILRTATAIVARRVLAAREHLRQAQSLKVMVIEDDVLVAMSIAQIVTHMGHEVCGVAQTSGEALARDRMSRPDLIVADVQLRDGDSGIATVHKILRRREVPVIFVTGYAHKLIPERQFHHSMVIGKPFASHTLEAAVRRFAVASMRGAEQPGL